MATKRWLGNATAIADVWTASLLGTVTSQTYTMTINSKTIAYVAGASDTVNTVITGLAAAWNNLSILPAPEFQELTASGLPVGDPFTSMTLTHDVPGRPTMISVSTSGAATFTVSNTTVATGPNDFANAQNWSGGVAPANSDTLVFDNGAVPCKYNLNTSLTAIVLNVNPGYTGSIGLPFINADGVTSYNEYRTTSLTLVGGTAVINAQSLQRCNLAFGANTATVRVLNTGGRLDQFTPVVLIQGGNASSELDITKGDVGIAFYQGQSATFPTIKTGYLTNVNTDVSLICGSGSVLTTLTKNGGVATVSANVTTINQDILGGVVTLTDSVTATTINAFAGTVILSTTGVVGTINLYGASTLSADQDPRAKTVTNPIQVYAPSVNVIDNQKSINSGTLSLATNGAPSVNVQHGANTSIVLT